jgi:hypothetical protein
MFYIKTKKPNGKMLKTEITDENVFTQCPECGVEMNVDLAELFSDGEGDLYSSSVICSVCTMKRRKKRHFSEGVTVTHNGLALLTDVLNKAGYGELVYDLFIRFGIEELTDLAPDQYKPFADALYEMAAGEFGL